MPGLLDTLENQFAHSGLTNLLSQQAGKLGAVRGAVTSLGNGPDLLNDLASTIGALPLPPGLGSLTSLGDGVSAAASGLPSASALAEPLGPLLTPLQALGTAAGGIEELLGVVNVVKGVVELATGKALGGPAGFPLGLVMGPRAFPGAAPGGGNPRPLDLDEMRAVIATAGGALNRFGAHLDAAALLDLLRGAGTHWVQMSRSWPTVPMLTDMVEAMETVVAWETRTPAQLTALLTETLHNAAQLIATPRTRVAQPFLDAAATAAGAAATLGAATTALAPTLASLATKAASDDGPQPSPPELMALETAADGLDKLVAALDLTTSPLRDTDALIGSLELTVLRVVRTLNPPGGGTFISNRIQGLVAKIPAPFTNPLAPVVAAVGDLDLTVLTDPLSAVRDEVEKAVTAVHDAEAAASAALTALLKPVDDALAGVLATVHLDDVLQALAALPATIHDFVENQIKPKILPLRDAIHAAVTAVSDAAAEFRPEEMLAHLRQAIQDATAFLRGDDVQGAFAKVKDALDKAVAAIEGLNLDGAADEAVKNIGAVEVKLSGINPSSIPEAAKPILEQAVRALTHIDFSAQVGGPLLKQVEQALEQGPALMLNSLEELLGKLETALEKFKPSVLIGAALDQPFEEMMQALQAFHPSDLLQRVADLLKHAVDAVHLVDPTKLLAPLASAYETIHDGVETLKPSTLLKPVNDEIAAAIDRVIKATRFDDLFDGLDTALATANGYIDVLASAGVLFERVAALLDAPGDIESGLDALVDAAVGRLDPVDFARVAAAFAETAAAVQAIDRDRVAGDLAAAVQAAATGAPAALASPAATAFKQAVRAFPLAALRARRMTPARARAVAALTRLTAAADALDDAAGPWQSVAPRLAAFAPDVQPRLATYARVTRLEGGSVFGEFTVAPADLDALKTVVRAALVEGLRAPVTLAFGAFKAIAPHAAVGARGIGALVDALHTKIAAVTGESGVGGVVHSVEDVVDLIRHIDLSPVAAPLDALFSRIEHAVTVLDPAPLAQALTAAADAIVALFNLSTLIDPADVQALDATYAQALDAIGQLSPRKVVGETLDPVFDEALGPVKALLELPDQLKAKVEEAGGVLTTTLTADLRRVEVAFDKMLEALPLEGGGSTSISASISVGAG